MVDLVNAVLSLVLPKHAPILLEKKERRALSVDRIREDKRENKVPLLVQ
jgi:hypothetical protein